MRTLGAAHRGAARRARACRATIRPSTPEPITPQDLAAWREQVRAELDAHASTLLASSRDACRKPCSADAPRSLAAARRRCCARIERCASAKRAASRRATTATITSARCCCSGTTSSSSTSRASRRGRSPSGARSTRRCATWPACSARSPTRAHAALRSAAAVSPREDRAQLGRAARGVGSARRAQAFLRGLRPRRARARRPVRRASSLRAACSTLFEIEKALYELRYELHNRPDWVGDPACAACWMPDADGRTRRGSTQPITAVWPGKPYPRGATWDGEGVNFALFSANADRGRAVPLRRQRAARAAAHRAARAHRRGLARLSAGGAARPALRLSRARTVRAGAAAIASIRTSC